MNLLARYGPILLGLVLGWLIVNPPEFLGASPMVRIGATLVLVAVALLASIVALAAGSLPADPEIAVAPEEPLTGMQHLVSAYQTLGFFPAGPPVKVEIKPPAVLLPLFHQEARTYGSVYRTTTMPPKVSYEFVSILEGDRGGLTTSPALEGASMPAAPGELRQVFPKADPAALYRYHLDAIAFLEKRGLRMRQVAVHTFVNDVKSSMVEKRQTFFKAPVTNSLITLWRVATKQVPETGPLQAQVGAQKVIEDLIVGRRA